MALQPIKGPTASGATPPPVVKPDQIKWGKPAGSSVGGESRAAAIQLAANRRRQVQQTDGTIPPKNPMIGNPITAVIGAAPKASSPLNTAAQRRLKLGPSNNK